jgi:hypothetical protein
VTTWSTGRRTALGQRGQRQLPVIRKHGQCTIPRADEGITNRSNQCNQSQRRRDQDNHRPDEFQANGEPAVDVHTGQVRPSVPVDASKVVRRKHGFLLVCANSRQAGKRLRKPAVGWVSVSAIEPQDTCKDDRPEDRAARYSVQAFQLCGNVSDLEYVWLVKSI